MFVITKFFFKNNYIPSLLGNKRERLSSFIFPAVLNALSPSILVKCTDFWLLFFTFYIFVYKLINFNLIWNSLILYYINIRILSGSAINVCRIQIVAKSRYPIRISGIPDTRLSPSFHNKIETDFFKL